MNDVRRQSNQYGKHKRSENLSRARCHRFGIPSGNVQVQRAAGKNLQVIEKSGYRRFVATVCSPLRGVVHWHPPEPSGSCTNVSRILVESKFLGRKHRLATPRSHLNIESQCPQTVQSAFSRQHQFGSLRTNTPAHSRRSESDDRLRRDLRSGYRRTANITGWRR